MSWPAYDPDRGFPLRVDAPRGPELAVWVRAQRASIVAALERAGALLFRDTELTQATEFRTLWLALDDQPKPYIEGQSRRERVVGDVYTSTAYPAAEVVTLHHELSYVRSPPRFLGFFCEIAPEEGGATPLADGRQLLAAMPPATRSAFEGRGIRYLKTMHGGRGMRFGKSWQEHFETDDRAAVEAHLRAGGVQWRWLDDGGLHTEQTRPAIRPHPTTGEAVWFNQASLWHISNLGERGARLREILGEDRLPTHATFEDGSPISDELMDEVRRLSWALAVSVPWRAGDLMLVDNATMLHGRAPFRGARRVLVAMGDGPLP